jgi:hypothetical protein
MNESSDQQSNTFDVIKSFITNIDDLFVKNIFIPNTYIFWIIFP